MKNRMRNQLIFLFMMILLLASVTNAQTPATKTQASTPVTGSGTPGRISRWSGVAGTKRSRLAAVTNARGLRKALLGFHEHLQGYDILYGPGHSSTSWHPAANSQPRAAEHARLSVRQRDHLPTLAPRLVCHDIR